MYLSGQEYSNIKTETNLKEYSKVDTILDITEKWTVAFAAQQTPKITDSQDIFTSCLQGSTNTYKAPTIRYCANCQGCSSEP